ncbi:MAG TPA: energy transducer TonB, partial [Chryseolinea sp.]|nr:energy transducer TonB [Chryseolinea sp.]
GTIVVSFKVDVDGRTSEVSAVEGPTIGGLRAEAIRVVKESGKWIPAQKNGHSISSYKKQPIRFRLDVQK